MRSGMSGLDLAVDRDGGERTRAGTVGFGALRRRLSLSLGGFTAGF